MSRISTPERIARDLLHHYHPELEQTWNERPKWLKNPQTGRSADLDIQFKEIQSAIEVQGVGGRIDDLHQDQNQWKIERCREFGIKLYVLTIHDLTQSSFAAFLRTFEQENRLLPNRFILPPHHLFAQAERLNRRKLVRMVGAEEESMRLNIKTSLLDRLVGWLQT